MRSNVVLAVDPAGFKIRLSTAQRALLHSVLGFFEDRPGPESLFVLWLGSGKDELRDLIERVSTTDSMILSLAELHTLHAALMSVSSFFSAEEPFHIQMGFYRENLSELAGGLVRAVQALERGSIPPES